LSSALYEVSSFREATIATAEYFWLSTARWSCRQHVLLYFSFISIRDARWLCTHDAWRWGLQSCTSCLHVCGEFECSWSRKLYAHIICRCIIYNLDLRWLTEMWQCAISYKKNFVFKWKKKALHLFVEILYCKMEKMLLAFSQI